MAEAVAGAVPSDNELVSAVVASVNPLAVNVRGALVTRSLGVLGSYVPAVGDNVQVMRQDASWLILGVGNNGVDGTLTLANYNSTAAATTILAAFSNVNPARFTWTKRFASTKARVDLAVSCFSTAVTTKPRFGVDFINASPSSPSPRVNMAEMLINAANDHTTIAAHDAFSGFAAGTYTVQLLWLRVSGAGTLTINADDWVSLMVTEVS
jgi:NAD(P)H-hydrate repair Nnr-like enzyme with NAD(P)H-hydrate epimerase domain